MTVYAELEKTLATLARVERYAVLINPADILPDRTFSEAALAAFAKLGDPQRLVGLPLYRSDGAPVGDPLLINLRALEEARRTFLAPPQPVWPKWDLPRAACVNEWR